MAHYWTLQAVPLPHSSNESHPSVTRSNVKMNEGDAGRALRYNLNISQSALSTAKKMYPKSTSASLGPSGNGRLLLKDWQ